MATQFFISASAAPLRGHQAVGGEDLVETWMWMTLYPSLHVFTTLIHAVSDTGRGLDAPFYLPLPGFTQPSPAQPEGWPEIICGHLPEIRYSQNLPHLGFGQKNRF